MESPRNAGPTLKERMAALQSASKSAAPRRKSIEAVMAAKAAVTAMKPQVMAGFLKRSAGEGKLADVFFQRYTALHADPMLCFYEDEECSRPKGSVKLVKGTTCTPSGQAHEGRPPLIVVNVPASDDAKAKHLKLQFPNAEGASAWFQAITSALHQAYPESVPTAPASERVSTVGELPAKAPSATAVPAKRGSSFWRPTFHAAPQLMGGVELGGENLPAPARKASRRKSSLAAPLAAVADAVSKLMTRAPSSYDGDLGEGDLARCRTTRTRRRTSTTRRTRWRRWRRRTRRWRRSREAEAAEEAAAAAAAEAEAAIAAEAEAERSSRADEEARAAAKARVAAAKKKRKAVEKAVDEARAAQRAAHLAEEWAIAEAEKALRRAEKAQRKRQARQAARQREATKKKAAAKKKAEKRAKKQSERDSGE